ncbi:metal-dependent hydrolase [Paenibacillus sp. NPDC056579]|uniref:metal-dependent hydrolase n=1 Tax=unclassified Paenibacillus TaxID=185978 RepID=UPI001EF87849|nr:metal-dependent hydrolase [Paenibacillus sp. H1-7]ULL15011.1 metal-dependent hydrolase [Paenibacillus sp. H1-7]
MLTIEYHGHSCIQLSDGEHSLVIDPFLTGNPLASVDPESIRVQHVLLTHAHADHIANAAQIARANDATIIAIHELATYMSWQGVKTKDMNIGGRLSLGFAELQMVQAFHSSGIIDHDKQQIVYAGMPAGFIIRWNGKTILHAGDTNLFLDMKLIGERNDIDVAFLPIGDLFTMGPEDAATAAEWLQAKQVVPVHYDTFELIRQDGPAFVDLLSTRGIQGKALKPGEKLSLS